MKEPAQSIAETVERIRLGAADLGPGPPPEPVDADFAQLASTYWAADAAGRAAIRTAVDDKDRLLLLVLGIRATELALRDRSATHLQNAITAHCIEDFRWDSRENLIRLAMIWYAADQLQLPASELFSSAAQRASPEAGQLLVEFAARPAASRSLRSMGIEAIDEDGRVRFRPRPRPSWRRAPVSRRPRGRG